MKKILLIDDDPNEHKLFDFYVSSVLNDQVELHNATTLDEGLCALSRQHFDAVFLDNRLKPYDDFRQTLPLLTGHVNGIRLFVISASVDDPCFDEVDAFPIDAVVDKYRVKDELAAGLLA
ncbi:MAG: hypothetical protein OXR62_14025 [Ahrensia sp.]|nr:hypothetical protein [Ahrensia sp.]